jgi:hypothetical protein
MAFWNHTPKKINPTHRGLEVSWSKWHFHSGDTLSKKYDYCARDKQNFQLTIQLHFSFQRSLMTQSFFIMEHDRNIGFDSAFYICVFSLDSSASHSTHSAKSTITIKAEALDDGRALFTTTDAESARAVTDLFAQGQDITMAIFGKGDDPILIVPIPNDGEFEQNRDALIALLPERNLNDVISNLERQ